MNQGNINMGVMIRLVRTLIEAGMNSSRALYTVQEGYGLNREQMDQLTYVLSHA